MMGCLALSPEQRFPKSSKFTDSIVSHGRWENNTLDEATNLRQRERRLKERTKQRMKQVSDKFRGEMEEVEMIQEIVRMRQHRLARANLHACCVVMIQVTWRRHRARKVAQERRGKILARILLRWWRRFKTRRSLAIIQRFVSSLILERAELTRQRSEAATTVQRAWKHRVARCGVHQVVVASAAIEVVTVNILADLAELVYLDSKADVISRVWRRLRVRPSSKHRKAPRGRIFLTQGGASSPRRKPRPPSSRGGLPSDPSMSPRGGSSSRGKSNNTSPGTTIGARPMIIAVIAAAATAAPFSPSVSTGTAPATVANAVLPADGSSSVSGSEQQQEVAVVDPPPECPLLRHSSAPSPENATNRRGSRGGSSVGLPRKLSRGGGDNAASRRTSSPAAAAATGSREELGQAVLQTPPVGDSSSVGSNSRTPSPQCDDDFRSPYASVSKRSGSCTSGVDFAGVRSGGGGAAVSEDSMASCTPDSATRKLCLPDEKVAGAVEGGAAAAAATMQPRRPNDVRRSKLLEGRPRAVVIGEQETQEATVDIVVENDAAVRAPIDDTAIRVLETEAVTTVDNVSTVVAAEANSTALPLPEVEGRSVGNGSSRSDVSGGGTMVATSVGRPESDVDATLLPVALDCHAEAEASLIWKKASKSEDSWTENCAVEEYAGDLFESDSHISLPP